MTQDEELSLLSTVYNYKRIKFMPHNNLNKNLSYLFYILKYFRTRERLQGQVTYPWLKLLRQRDMKQYLLKFIQLILVTPLTLVWFYSSCFNLYTLHVANICKTFFCDFSFVNHAWLMIVGLTRSIHLRGHSTYVFTLIWNLALLLFCVYMLAPKSKPRQQRIANGWLPIFTCH